LRPGSYLAEDKPLTCVSYIGGAGAESVPPDATYQAAWEGMPAYWRGVLTQTRAEKVGCVIAAEVGRNQSGDFESGDSCKSHCDESEIRGLCFESGGE
jgi:hypothetical protein